jgi:DnaJ-class molecular chaperone
MVETMTTETAYAILGIPVGANFAMTAKAFRKLRDKYDPETKPHHRKELAEVMAAFEFLQHRF